MKNFITNKNEKLIFYRHNKKQKAFNIRSHKIDFYELTAILYGKVDYVINGEKITLETGDMLFLPQDTTRIRKPSKDNVDYVSFNFLSNQKINLPIYINNGITNQVRMIINTCDEIKKHFLQGSDEIIMSLLKSIILIIDIGLENKDKNPIIVKIQKYIQKNLKNKITLKDVARVAAYSPSYLDTLFKKETGISINNYCIELRIDKSKRLILEKMFSLKEIAENVGFLDYNYFARTFKKRTGYTPSEYGIKDM